MSDEKRNLPDWIDAYLEFTDNSEPPFTYRLWSAISTVAACLQRKCVLRWGFWEFFPNMYVVLVGPSGTGKGMAMKPAQELLREVGIKCAADATTREKLIRELRRASTTNFTDDEGSMAIHSSMTIFSGELVVFLGYKNLEMISMLTDWYDCKEEWRYETKHDLGGGNVDDIRGVWVNLLGGTTPDLIRSSMPTDAIGGGLTGRIVFVYEQRKGKVIYVPILTEREKELRPLLVSDLGQVKLLSGEFKSDQSFIDAWIDWRKQCEVSPPFDDSNYHGYTTRRHMHTMKLALILNASRTNSMILTAEDMQRAERIIVNTEQKMQYTFSGLGKSNISSTISQVLIELEMTEEITFEELLSKFYGDVDKFGMDRVIETLKAMGAADDIIKGKERTIVKRMKK